MILTDAQIELAFDNIAKSLLSRGLSDRQVVEHLREETNRIESELKFADAKPN